jgi:predicted nuclease with TOPRIM domain
MSDAWLTRMRTLDALSKKAVEHTEALKDERDQLASRLAEVEAERDEALRRRDAWKARAEGHVEIVNAMRAKTAGKDSRTLGRALLGAAKMEAEARADALQREVDALRGAGDKLSFAAQTSGGTAGRDEGLVAAIDGWAAASAALETRSEQGEG